MAAVSSSLMGIVQGKSQTTVRFGSLLTADTGYAVSEEARIEAIKAAALIQRALPNSPSGYTPTHLDCPSENAPTIRNAGSLSPNETAWLDLRRNNTVQPMRELITRLNISGFDAGSYIDQHANNKSALPNIGIAVSGGGWRALLNGAGAIKAFDSRTTNSTAAGQLGGLLQSATYLAGLSGGSWLVGSIYTNNFTSVEALVDDTSGSVWEFGNSVIEGPAQGGIQIFSTAQYLDNIKDDVEGKADAGFNTSITDIWGRALSYQLINATEGGPAYTWSSVALTSGFQDASQPFPILVSDNRAPGTKIISSNSSVFEFNPFEMGSWDPTVFGFMPTHYLGTNMSNGSVTQNQQCVVGFDNCGFVMGTSSSLFNEGLLEANSSAVSSGLIQEIIIDVLGGLSEARNDIADYSPNPFYGWNTDSNPTADSHRLTLVDGGEDGQNIPLDPLIQPFRHIDVIFAVDSSADTSLNWPNATSLVATYERSLTTISNGTGFPSVPDQNTIINLGLNTHPTFFGCNASNITQGTDVPLIVYLPNSPYSAYSNTSTFQLETNDTQRDALILNGANVVTMGNATFGEDWPACVACAILSRSFTKTGTTVPDACTQCFNKYCWDGTLNSTTPADYDPTPRLSVTPLSSKASLSMHPRSWTALAGAITVGIVLAL